MFVGGRLNTHNADGDSDTESETEEENASQSDLIQVLYVCTHSDDVIMTRKKRHKKLYHGYVMYNVGHQQEHVFLVSFYPIGCYSVCIYTENSIMHFFPFLHISQH